MSDLPQSDCRKFRFTDDKSDKFWHIQLEGSRYTVTFGRVGSRGQSQCKPFTCQFEPEAGQECRIAAVKAYLKAIDEKLRKGYVEVDVTPETRQWVVRSFFETQLVDYMLETDTVIDFASEHRIAGVRILSIDSEFDRIEITAPPSDLPQAVAEAYQRYVWCSQYSLVHLALLKLPIAGQTAYAVLISGFSDDGWDNSGMWLEVFDEEGEFLGAADLWEVEDQCEFVGKSCEIAWKAHPLDQTIFNSVIPAWPGWGAEVQFPDAVWSEALLARYADRIETEGSTTRYFLPEDDCYLLDARDAFLEEQPQEP